MTQKIRKSQFVITYGPGAILEGQGGSRVIPRADLGLFPHLGVDATPQAYEISDQRMSQGLLHGARIFRIPSNAELGANDDHDVYHTRRFPEWLLCQQFHNHGGFHSILFLGRYCPICPGGTPGNWPGAVRFIVACRRGHMDDANWPSLAHRGRDPCGRVTHFIWRAGTGSLSQIEVECPHCHAKGNLGDAYGRDWPCSGRLPELEGTGPTPRPGCDVPAKMVQKQASNLRLTELSTLFTIPPRYTRLHALLQLTPVISSVRAVAVTHTALDRDVLAQILDDLVNAQHSVRKSDADEILSYPWPEVEQALRDIQTPVPTQYHVLLEEEFEALVRASEDGAPPLRGLRPTSQVIFQVDPHRVRQFPGPGGTMFRVTPVLTLRTVTVQRGYRREVDLRAPSEVVDVAFTPGGGPGAGWYPGVEFLGEGVFVMLEPHADQPRRSMAGDAQRAWLAASRDSVYPEYLFRDPTNRVEMHPMFVWWHTFAHLLLRATSIEAGYSSASVRERVYLSHLQNPARVRGGILLYATQPGTDGTLGGLIALVPSFGTILNQAYDAAQYCSGDPLCIEHRFARGAYNGSACYACLLLSETSCEHRNMWLDRAVFLDNLP
jgi:hypothetical protein